MDFTVVLLRYSPKIDHTWNKDLEREPDCSRGIMGLLAGSLGAEVPKERRTRITYVQDKVEQRV
jgi:hypothetical protein